MMPSLNPQAQGGAALIVSLLFLVILTLIGASAMTTTTLEERMAGNAKDLNIAFQAAEAALRDGWDDLNGVRISGASGFDTACPGGLCERDFTNTSTPVWYSVDWMAPNPTVELGSQTGGTLLPTGPGGVAKQPRYIVEAFVDGAAFTSVAKKQYIYRVTARGFGSTVNAQAMTQASYKRP